MNDELMRAIGRLEAQVQGMDARVTEGQSRLEAKIDGMDTRLRAVEVVSAKSGAVTGGLTALLVTAGVEFIRSKFGA